MPDIVFLRVQVPRKFRAALNAFCSLHDATQAQVMEDALRLFMAVHDGDRLIEVDEATQERLQYVLANAVAPAEVA
jgi:hypothetical protein